MSPRQIPLIGGPMNGQIHELHGAIMPAEIGLTKPDNKVHGEIHWYALSRSGLHRIKGYYSRTERAKGAGE